MKKTKILFLIRITNSLFLLNLFLINKKITTLKF